MSQRTKTSPLTGSRIAIWKLTLLLGVFFGTTACSAENRPDDFRLDNLLSIDPSDVSAASLDMLAVFSYTSIDAVHFRIDFLDFSVDEMPDLTLLVDSFPGGCVSSSATFGLEHQWETILHSSPDQVPQIKSCMNPSLDPTLISIQYDPRLDTITLSAPLEIINPPGPFQIALISHSGGSLQPADILGPVQSDHPIPEPLPILIALWDSFPSETPAQALRSWDGAHNGPAGERFGLYHFLQAVETHQIPVVVSDLVRPSSLDGLLLLGAQPWIQVLESQGLLTLAAAWPASLCEEPANAILAAGLTPAWVQTSSRSTARGSGAITCFDHVDDSLAYLLPAGFRSSKSSVALPGREPLYERFAMQGFPVIPLLEGDPSVSLGHDGGPSLTLRHQWAEALSNRSMDEVFLIHANFQESFWGDPHSATDTFSWIKHHPWLQPISMETFARGHYNLYNPPYQSQVNPSDLHHPLETEWALRLIRFTELLDGSNTSMVEKLIWRIMLESFPTRSCQDVQVNCDQRHEYIEEAYSLLSLARSWENLLQQQTVDPLLRASTLSFNNDHSRPIYMSDEWLVVLGESGSRVDALFTYDPLVGVIPVIWRPFYAHQAGMETDHQISVSENSEKALKLEFKLGDRDDVVDLPIYLSTHQLNLDAIRASWSADQGQLTLFYTPNLVIQVGFVSESHELISVLDSPASWAQSEDPNQEMPPGHFLPFPYAVLRLSDPVQVSLSLGHTGVDSSTH